MKVAIFRGIQPGIGPALFDYMVHWWCAGPYSHAAVVVGTDAAGVSTLASSTVLGGGVSFQDVNLTADNWDVYEVPGSFAAAQAWMAAHLGQGYDYIGLARYVAPRGEGEKSKWYCSEAVAAMLGWDEPWRFDPNLLACVCRNLYPAVTLPLAPSANWM